MYHCKDFDIVSYTNRVFSVAISPIITLPKYHQLLLAALATVAAVEALSIAHR